MSEELDYYKILELEHGADIAAVKAAHKKLVLRYHPDRHQDPAKKEEVTVKYKLVNKAYEVLSDEDKKSIYDRFGHKGLDTAKAAGDMKSNGPGPRRSEKMSDDGVADFFDRKRADRERAEATTTFTPSTADRSAAAEERRRLREQRRNGGDASSAPARPRFEDVIEQPRTEQPRAEQPRPATPDFSGVAAKVDDARSKLRSAEVPLEALQKFRENLQDFIGEVDAAIARAKNNNGPRR